MLSKLRDKLSPKDKALFKLVLWSVLVVWMVMYFAFTLAMARLFESMGPYLFGKGVWGQTMTFLLPIWSIFTNLLIITLIARYARRKLGVPGSKKD